MPQAIAPPHPSGDLRSRPESPEREEQVRGEIWLWHQLTTITGRSPFTGAGPSLDFDSPKTIRACREHGQSGCRHASNLGNLTKPSPRQISDAAHRLHPLSGSTHHVGDPMPDFSLPSLVLASALGPFELPRQLERIGQSLAEYQWQDAGYSIGVLLVAWLLGRVVSALVVRGLAEWSTRTDTILDDAIVRHLKRPIAWLIPALSARLLVPLLSVPTEVAAFLARLLLLGIIAGIGWLLVRVLSVLDDVVMQRYDVASPDNLKARSIRTQLSGVRNIAGFVIVLLTISFMLLSFESVRQLGTGLLASAGIAGIVMGFAAQRSISTVLAGMQIAITQPIRVDDVVIVEGEWGRIEEITLTYVVVRIWDLRRLVVPINYFLEKPFQNWTRTSARILGTVELYVDYTVPIDEVRKEFKRILDGTDLWDKDVWGIQVTACSERTMTLRPLMSAKDSGAAWNLRCEVRERLLTFIREKYPHALPRHRAMVDKLA